MINKYYSNTEVSINLKSNMDFVQKTLQDKGFKYNKSTRYWEKDNEYLLVKEVE